MSGERWKSGWQEDAFARGRAAFCESPAWYRNLAPADLADDAFLLGWASSLFLRDGAAPAQKGAPPPAKVPGPVPVVGAPAFPYERCLRPGADASGHFASAAEGRCGDFHRATAARAGGEGPWTSALAALHNAGALRTSLAADPALHDPPLATTSEDINACVSSVLRKTLHAFKIGFGLWGRWEGA